MGSIIYVQLLNEGVSVYRPVPAVNVAPFIYIIDSDAPYDSDDEEWEFPPGSRVMVEERRFGNENKLIAIRLIS